MPPRTRRAGFSILGLTTACGLALAVAPSGPPPLPSTPTGSGSCAARACHGGAGEIAGSRVARTESLTWLLQDPHAQAARTLREAESARIVAALGWKGPAEREARCLACHATPPGSLIGPAAAAIVAEGVGCESCHGPASNWLADHASESWHRAAPDRKRARGMTPLDDLADRVRACAGCHVGAPPDPERGFPVARDVNHDLIAAGHPRLTFEFFSTQERMPRHWNDKAGVESRLDFPARAWQIGQVVAARSALDLLKQRAAEASAGRAPWPEFAEYECASCHHPLVADGPKPSPGVPVWGSWYFPMLELLDGDLASRVADLGHLLERPAPVGPDLTRRIESLARRLDAPALLEVRPEGLARALAEGDCAGADRAALRYLGLVPVTRALERIEPAQVDPELGRVLRRLLDRANGHDL